jgi:glycosyltransferase involved in cell wall biosynthesis
MSIEPDDFSLLMAPGPVPALLVVDDSVLRRVGTFVRHICVGMIDEAVQVTVLSRSVPSAAGEAIGPSSVVTQPRRWLPWASRLAPDEMLEVIGGNRPQVVHCLSTELAHWTLDYAVAWNTVLIVHLTDMKDVRAFGGLGDYPHLSALTNTAMIERALLEAHPEMQGRVTTVPLGIPSEDDVACYDDVDQVPAVIMTTPLEHGSGLELALRALQIVKEAGEEMHLFILSDGNAEAAFRRQLDRLKLRSMVTFAGSMHDSESLRIAMAASDLYLIPIAPERFNAYPLMAMATGLAILAPQDTMEDYLVDGQTARLFDARVSDLAAKWIGLLQDHEQARQLARGAQEYVHTYHKASFMVCAIAVLYRQAVARLKRMRSGSPGSSVLA